MMNSEFENKAILDNSRATKKCSTRVDVLPAFISVIMFAFILYAVMVTVQPSLLGSQGIIDYSTWQSKAASEPLYRFLWLIGDMTEAPFHKTILGGVGLVLFSFIAYLLARTKSKWQGFTISGGADTFIWVFLASILGLSISVLLFGNNIANGWVPTFVPFVSVPAAVVLIYGGGYKNTITAAVLGSVFTFPISNLIIEKILTPWNLPALSGNTLGMCFGGIIVFEMCNALPWMKIPEVKQVENPDESTSEILEETDDDEKKFNNIWFVRRMLADLTEANFYGNELASIGLILGSLIAWGLNPHHPAYGSLNFPALLLGQFLTGAISIFVYYDNWKTNGWYPTFLSGVSIAPAIVLFFGGSIQSILAGSIIGAITAPPLAHFISKNVPKHWHPFVGNTFSMGVCTIVITSMLKYISPIIGLVF